jgi:hypothetical protein
MLGGGVMERLTYRDKDGFPMMKKRGGFKQGGVERLAAYEDTGLTPKEAKRMSNILMDVGIDYNCSWEYVKNWLLDDRLRELAEADKDGRLVVLPFSDADDVEMQRDGITYKSDHWNILLTAFADNYLTLSGRKLGVFSVNEAEKALEAMKNE